MLPTPNINLGKIPECQKHLEEGSHRRLYTFSPSDYKEMSGIWGNGEKALPGDPPGELEVVEGMPDGGKIHQLTGVPSAFTPDYAPEEMFEIATKLIRRPAKDACNRPALPETKRPGLGKKPGRRIQLVKTLSDHATVWRCLLVEAGPAFTLVDRAAIGHVDRHGAIHDRLDGRDLAVGGTHRHHRTTTPNRLGVVMRVALLDAGAGERPDEAAGCTTRHGPRGRGSKPAGSDHGPDAGNGKKAEAGQEPSGAADSRPDAGPFTCVTVVGRLIALIAAEEADIGRSDAGGLELFDDRTCGRVAVVGSRDGAGHGRLH